MLADCLYYLSCSDVEIAVKEDRKDKEKSWKQKSSSTNMANKE